MTLLICRTCLRYDCRSTGQFGRELAAAITAAGADVPVRNARAIIKAALAHQASTTGDPGDWAVPEELASRISSITTKRKPVAQSGPPRPATFAPRPGRQARFPCSPPATETDSRSGRQEPRTRSCRGQPDYRANSRAGN